MTRLSTPLRSTLLTLALGAGSLAALAQTAAPAAPTAPSSSAGSHRHPAERQDRMHARLGQHLDKLKGRLQLSAAQEGDWARFSSALQARPAHAGHEARHQELMGLNTPERLDRMKALRAQHQAEMNTFMDRRSDATKAFYATLTAEQKKVFDAEGARFMQARHGAGDRGHEGRGHHGMGHGARS